MPQETDFFNLAVVHAKQQDDRWYQYINARKDDPLVSLYAIGNAMLHRSLVGRAGQYVGNASVNIPKIYSVLGRT